MSKFLTCIPVDVQAVLNALPQRAFPLDVRFNPELSRVEVEWDDDDLVTPYSFALDYPFEDLKKRQVPDKVKVRTGAKLRSGPASRRYEMAKAKPQELPGGPTTEVTRHS